MLYWLHQHTVQKSLKTLQLWHVTWCAHTQHIKRTNTALLKNYQSHDHCLCSKWKRGTCMQTHHTYICPTCQSRVSSVDVEGAQKSIHSIVMRCSVQIYDLLRLSVFSKWIKSLMQMSVHCKSHTHLLMSVLQYSYIAIGITDLVFSLFFSCFS